MGMAIESAILKATAGTNDRLDRLIAAQERTNQLLEWLAKAAPGAYQQ